MKVIETPLDDLYILEPKIHGDSRGFLFESYRDSLVSELLGESTPFVQDNYSHSCQNVLRGMHFQQVNPQGKLVHCLAGEVFDVVVDLRRDSVTYGQSFSVSLNAESHRQLLIPKGFAHGFCVISDYAIVHYKCTAYYEPDQQAGVLWSDEDLGIDWPVSDPILSPKDQALPLLKDLSL
jgi:dTDP-4-dehydrorhamnose 3,5-epimerase